MKKLFTIVALALLIIMPQSIASQTTGTENGHAWVDLGLPSGTLWATCNVRANSPEEYGAYFAWGEIQPSSIYDWSNYKYCKGSDDTFTKYCSKSSYGYNGFTDSKTVLDLEDDAANANWGGNWRMPTYEEFLELINNTTCRWTEDYNDTGVKGGIFTGSNGNAIFLPATGWFIGTSHNYAGINCNYWTSTLDTILPINAYQMDFNANVTFTHYHNIRRRFGHTVRPVRGGNAAATGIESMNVDSGKKSAPMYNVMGQRVGRNYKGIVIQNGRKLVR